MIIAMYIPIQTKYVQVGFVMLKKLKEMPPGDIRDLPTPKERPSINGKRREEEGKK